MKAAVYHSLQGLRIEERPKPRIKSDEILVEMKACGICGTDLLEWYLKSKAPLVLGHEPVGVVTKVGRVVKDFQIGDRVFVHHHVACLTCHYCIRGNYTVCPQFTKTHIEPGGLSEYFKVPASNLHIDTLKLPQSIAFEEATLIEPIACCIRAQNKCGIQPGDTVAIIGAGPSGAIHTVLAGISGASQIIVSDLVDYRLKLAKELGATCTVNIIAENLDQKIRGLTNGRGADKVFVTAPNTKALLEGIKVCRSGGIVCLYAPTEPNENIQISPKNLFFSEITILPSYSASHLETRSALQLMISGKIKARQLITHLFPLNEAAKALKTASSDKECLKVVVLNKKQ
jgi:L-iditol 2-dehydrogenase